MREGRVITNCSPVLSCDFATNKTDAQYPGTVTFDTGASRSYVHESLLRNCKYQISGSRKRNYYGAGGKELQLLPYVVDMMVDVKDLGRLEFCDVLVASRDQPNSGTMLVGVLDMKRLGAAIDFKSGKMLFQLDQLSSRKAVPMLEYQSNMQAAVLTVMEGGPWDEQDDNRVMKLITYDPDHDDSVFNNTEDWIHYEDMDKVQTNHKLPMEDGWSQVATQGDPCITNMDECVGCDRCVDKELQLELSRPFKCPANDPKLKSDPKTAMLRILERTRQRDRSTFTNHEITIDPVGEAEHPVAAAGIRKLVNSEKYKRIFAKDIGCTGEEFAVGGVVTGQMSRVRPGATKFTGETKDAVIKQLTRLKAHGVIASCREYGVEPQNVMRLMAVQKKDDDGNIVAPLNGLRLVLAANETNAHTKYAGLETDSLEECLTFAAEMTKSGLNFKGDLSDCYHLFELKEEMWPYFCLQFPDDEVHFYKRLIQGWNRSGQAATERLSVIFWPVSEYLRKYMDDVAVGVSKDHTDEDFLVVFENFLQICLRHDLRLKGSKCFFLTKTTNYLGYEVSNGTIGPNPHRLLKLQLVEAKHLTTKAKIKTYLGMIGFVQKFMKRSAGVLGPLRKRMSGNGSDPVVCDAELIHEVERVKRALKEMVATHPFNPELPTVVVVDTSLQQTGGFIYQMDGKVPKFIAFYSRNRVDAERKIFIGSCHIEVLGFGGLLQAFFPMFKSAKLPITLITDSSSFVKLYAKFKRNEIPSTDTAINNVFYYMGIILNFNVIHMKNTEAKMMFSDGLSRITQILGLPEPKNECKGANSGCKICIAANMIDNGTRISTVMDYVCQDTIGVIREGVLEKMHRNDFKIFAIRREPVFKRVHLTTIKQLNLKLDDLLNSREILRELQLKCPDLRKMRKALDKGQVNFQKRDARLTRMKEDENARVVNDVIYLTKEIDGIKREVIPMPLQSAPIVIAATHATVGHRSPDQLTKQVKRHFWFQKMKDMVTAFTDNCVRCCLEKSCNSNFKKSKLTPVPVPRDVFTTILIDEMVRTFKGQSIKIVVAMEAVSQFVTCIVYDGSMNSGKFLAIVANCKAILCPHGLDNVKVALRVDSASWHTSAVVRDCLTHMNVELQLHESTTFSKNIVPELDAKMKTLGKYLSHFMESAPVTLPVAAQLAAAKCNSTIGQHGHTPGEIFSGRGWRDNKFIQIDTRALLERIVKKRESMRLSREREIAARNQKKELQLIPYEDDDLNSPLVRNRDLIRIRVGDWVKLRIQKDKNEIPSAWLVMDIDFPKKKLLLKRTAGAETGQGDTKWVGFELVDQVFKKSDVIYHIHGTFEYNEDEAEKIWVQGRQDVSKLVLDALVATHDLWAGPEDWEEDLIPNLQFGRSLDESGPLIDLSCRHSRIPRDIVATPKKEEKFEFVDEDEFKEEWVTPDEFSTPMDITKIPKEESKAKKKEDLKIESPPKLQLDQSLEEEPLPEPSGSSRRSSSRVSKPVQKFQAGQKSVHKKGKRKPVPK